MKFTFALILYNEEKLIKPQLERLYDYAHDIIICEGLVGECKHAWSKERDNTVDIIKSFPDPKNKIKLISKDDWPGKEHMVRAYWAKASGDYVWHIDADEFYTHRCMRRTIKHVEKTKELQYAHYYQHYYYKYLNVIVEETGKTFWYRPGRIHKCDKSYTLVHRPQCLYRSGNYAHMRYIKEGKQHHYSMMDHDKTTSKLKFYTIGAKRYCNAFERPIKEVLQNKLEVRLNSTIRILKPKEIEIPEGVDKLYKMYKP
jgi:glycosyltransferase involved in cell wall biosynthesis